MEEIKFLLIYYYTLQHNYELFIKKGIHCQKLQNKMFQTFFEILYLPMFSITSILRTPTLPNHFLQKLPNINFETEEIQQNIVGCYISVCLTSDLN